MADKKKRARGGGKGIKEGLRGIGRALAELDRQFGKGAVMRLGDHEPEPVEVFSTGSLRLDHALGVGGLPRGRVVEIYGPESSGKTTMTLHAVAEAQRAGGTAAFVDAEHALDVVYAANLGVQTDDLLVAQPNSGEHALEIVEALARSGEVDLIVVDSVAALTPQAELDGQMGDSHVGLQARLMSQALRKLTAVAHKENVTVVFINQLRMKIGVMFGSPETTTGGNALKFYSSVRLDIRRIGGLKKDDEPYGNRTRVKVVKNKLAPPFRTAEFDLLFGKGVDRAGEVLDFGVEHGVVDKSGAWFSWRGERLGQGRENVLASLREDPERLAQMESEVRRALALGGSALGVTGAELGAGAAEGADAGPADGADAGLGDAPAQEAA